MTTGLSVQALRSPLAGPFDLTVPRGSCAAVTGPSGSGKSLFLRMIADLDPNQGMVDLDGVSRIALPATDWRKRVSYVAAESGWWTDLVAQHFPARELPAARELMQRLGLKADLLDAAVIRLSTGEKQRLSLLRALLAKPDVLLLDEPTSALDEDATGQVELLLRERLDAGTSLILVTHDARQARRLGHAHYRMAAGRMEIA